MPVGEMLERMTSRELTEWMAYFSIQNEKPNDQKKKNNDLKDMLTARFAKRIVKK